MYVNMLRNAAKRNVTHSRIDRFTQMSKQEEIIAEKKKEIEAKLKAKTKNSKSNEKESATTEAKEDKKVAVPNNEQVLQAEEPTKVNVFSNDGSFLEQFKKLSDTKTLEASRKDNQENNSRDIETHDESKRNRSNKHDDRSSTSRNESRNVGRLNRNNESRNNEYRNYDNHSDMRHNENRSYDHRNNDNRNNDNRFHSNRHNDYRNNGNRQNESRNYEGRRNNHRDDDRRNIWDNREDSYGSNRHIDDRNWNRNKDSNHYSFNKESNSNQSYQNNSFHCSQESPQNNHQFSSSFNNGPRSQQSFNSQFDSNASNHNLQNSNNIQMNQFSFNGNDMNKNQSQPDFHNRPMHSSLQMPSNQFDVSSPPPGLPKQPQQSSHPTILPLLSTNLNIHPQNLVAQSHRLDAPPPLLATINTNVPPPNMVPIHSIPEPKPLQANLIPSPGPLNLQSIPPPLPICVNQIPKPKEMDLGNIPPPKQFNLSKIQIPDDYNKGFKNNQVLSTDSRHSLAQPQLQNENEAIHRIAKMVAENGDAFEEKLKQNSQHDPDVWFLFDKSSRAYKDYENILNKLKAENSSDEVKYNPYDIYHPEFSLDDDENYNSDSKDNIKNLKSENNDYQDYKHQNSSPLKWKDEDQFNKSFDQDDKYSDEPKPKRKRRSRWADEPQMNVPPPSVLNIPGLGDVATGSVLPLATGPPLLSKITRTDPALLQYAQNTFGTTNLSEEDWAKAEDHYKINLLYQDMLRKRNELDRLSKSGKFKYDYDSDEETEGGTWEHKLRMQEMEATQAWSSELTKKSEGKHHIGDFLPPDELKKFMEQYSAVKHGREPDISDYKEYKLKENNVGFQMLQKLGWKEGEGLGAEGAGIIDPVNKAFQRDSNQGLGVDRPDTIAQNDNEYDAYRKRMMLAYRFRPNPLNNPRRPYY